MAGEFTRTSVGDIEVIALFDGTLELPLSLFPEAEAPGQDRSFGPGPFPTAINCFAVRTGGQLYLVDAGSGPWRDASTGHLPASLAAAGLDPADVEAVLMTHLHGDHAGGLRDRTGAAAFPEAELLLSEDEAAFWLDPGLPSRAPERMRPTIANAAAALDAYADRTSRVRPGQEVAPGVTAVALPGHTPGQVGYRIESGRDGLFIWADVVHVAAIQFPHPEWPIGFDVDGWQAAETRMRAFEESARDGTRVLGMHLDFPGSGRVVRGKGGFAWAPDAPAA